MNPKNDITQKLVSLGFTPPQINWTRRDPRGPEYGTYSVRALSNGDLCVSYHSSGSACPEFSFYFTSLGAFERWASHTF